MKKKIILPLIVAILAVFACAFAACGVASYKINYVYNGFGIDGTVETSNALDYTLPVPEAPGYKFCGWYTVENFEGIPVTTVPAGHNGDITLYAKFRTGYSVKYNLEGGSGNDNPSIFCDEDEITLVPATRDGYEFVGWTDAEGGKVTVIPKGTTESKELTANWKPATYEITWDLQGGKANGALPEKYTFGEGVPSSRMPKAVKSGSIFGGWKNGEEVVNGIGTDAFGDLTLTAAWVNAVAFEQAGCWYASKSEDNASGKFDFGNDSSAVSIKVPSELKGLMEEGRLGLRVTATFYVNSLAAGGTTIKPLFATARGYLVVNNYEYKVAETTAKGGTYIGGLGIVAQPGSWAYSGNQTRSETFRVDRDTIYIGYRYEMENGITNNGIMGTAYYSCQAGCASIRCEFYIR